jgi:hypothetical protein
VLFTYHNIDHTIDKLHEFLEDTVLKVWCNPRGTFKVEKLHKDFQPIVLKISKNKNDYLLKPIKSIYNIFKDKLTPEERQKVADAFLANNQIEQLCKGDVAPVRYDDIEVINPRLAKLLKSFCENLYNHVLSKAAFRNQYEDLKAYYKKFIASNEPRRCPFCGINRLPSKRSSYRGAFDHYLPKSETPFNSVNTKNLVVACDECNEKCKKAQIPCLDDGHSPRPAFFPFSKTAPQIEFKVKHLALVPMDADKNEVELEICSQEGCDEEVQTWRTLYKLDERYDNIFRSDDVESWLKQAEAVMNYPEGLDKHLSGLNEDPLFECNFLRVPFLEACLKEGIISV